MDTRQFSTEFDVLFNSITSNQGPSFNGYEKSVFLTKAEIQLVQERLNPRLDQAESGFDGSPRRQVDFSSIIEWTTLERITENISKFDPRSILYAMPSNVLFPLDEELSLTDYSTTSYSSANEDTYYTVVPIAYNEYSRLMSKPYKFPPKEQAWRLMTKKHTFTTSESTTYTTQKGGFLLYSSGDNPELVAKVSCASYSNSDRDVLLALGLCLENSTIEELETAGYTIVNFEEESTLSDLESTLKALTSIPILGVDILGDSQSSLVDLFSKGVLITFLVNGSIKHTTPATTVTKQLLEVIGKFPSTPYYRMRYVRVPKPIILENLTDYNENINGITAITECELPEELHHEILERAVTLAKIAWQGNTATQTSIAAQSGK